ncbi:maspardin-like [Apostichopus japonicus]|uniref:maspardin-like n=1 Tax=Stichopus japonicus TaxID=307972 RepID=UPI003AB34D63
MGLISESQEYKSFRSNVPQKKVIVDDNGKTHWTLYDAGPRNVRCPLVCLPPVSGTADVYFKQLLGLSAKGYRVIAMEFPVHWNIQEFCESFRKLLDNLRLDKVHIFGSSLGGFLAQKFAEYTFRSSRVASLILCNTFVDTEIFQQSPASSVFWMMPSFVLKRTVLQGFDTGKYENDIADSIDFMVERLETLSQKELASRLAMNCSSAYVEPQKYRDVDVTILDVFDKCALSQSVKEEVYKCYPNARRSHLKTGGNFPYLSRDDEVNMHLQVHLRKFLQGRYTARDPRIRDPAPEEIREPSPEPPGAEAGAAYPEEMASDGQEVDGSE